jgi:hypothetical protein
MGVVQTFRSAVMGVVQTFRSAVIGVAHLQSHIGYQLPYCS